MKTACSAQTTGGAPQSRASSRPVLHAPCRPAQSCSPRRAGEAGAFARVSGKPLSGGDIFSDASWSFIEPAAGGILVPMSAIRHIFRLFAAGRLATLFAVLFVFPIAAGRPEMTAPQSHRKAGRRGAGWGATAIVTTVLFFCGGAVAGPQKTQKERLTFVPSGISIIAEIADSPEQRTRGLMYRTSLGEAEGMIFYFEQAGGQAFWMYHTRIPLTVIFLDESLTIVDMQNMSPCLEKNAESCPTYVSRAAARYAIEVNQGFVGTHRIKIGDSVVVGEAVRQR